MHRPAGHPLTVYRIVTAIILALALGSCGKNGSVDNKAPDRNQALSGTWTLHARLADGKEVPITERFMKITLTEDGTFRALYRGESTQKWIVAGQGGYSYTPPSLNLYWDSGQVLTLLVVESEPNRLRLHHGPALAPLKDQEPDDIFVRDTTSRGPTRGSS
jgi:hypothetical protein